MRAMVIMYVGPNPNPDFHTDFLLSPICTPDELLVQFPKTYLMCGEKDPFVDDTVVFAGRIRDAKRKNHRREADRMASGFGMTPNSGPILTREQQDKLDHEAVQVKILRDVSHAFLNMLALWPESRGAIRMLGGWLGEIINSPDQTPKSMANGSLESSTVMVSRKEANGHLMPNGTHDLDTEGEEEEDVLHMKSRRSSASIDSSGLLSLSSSMRAESMENSVVVVEPKSTKAIPHEHHVWEKSTVVSETKILARRRENLVGHLKLDQRAGSPTKEENETSK